jgi:hypothetical protein
MLTPIAAFTLLPLSISSALDLTIFDTVQSQVQRRNRWFADSPLVEAVSSEPVSETGFPDWR